MLIAFAPRNREKGHVEINVEEVGLVGCGQTVSILLFDWGRNELGVLLIHTSSIYRTALESKRYTPNLSGVYRLYSI